MLTLRIIKENIHSYIQLSILPGIKADWFDGSHHHHHTESHGDKEHDHMLGAIFQCQLLIFFFLLFHHLQCVTLGSSIRQWLRVAPPPPFIAVLMPFSTVILKAKETLFQYVRLSAETSYSISKIGNVTVRPEINNRFTITWVLKTWGKKTNLKEVCS